MVESINNGASQSSVSQVLRQQQQNQQAQQVQNDQERIRAAQLQESREIERTRGEQNRESQTDPNDSQLGRSIDVSV